MNTAQAKDDHTDVAVIGAGPAGSTVAALLRDKGWRVTVVERSHFPRFAIGESLLPRCMESLAAAGMLEPVQAAGFQIKRGVTFAEGTRQGRFDFADQYTPGWDWTWQVARARFDDILAREAQRRGADMRFGETIEDIDFSAPGAPRVAIARDNGQRYRLGARFICDASGFARVLPKMLDLERCVDAPPRAALFTHVRDRIDVPSYRRDDILIGVHPERPDVWYWLIGLGDGRASVGVIGDPAFIAARAGDGCDHAERLRALIAEEPNIAGLLANAVYDSPVRARTSYAVGVSTMHGRDYALLGNAGEFVDPLFSSGVTVALESAMLASGLIDRQLHGQTPAWDTEFEAPLRHGLRVFRSFVDSWYSGALKNVFFKSAPDPDIRRMLNSILAGYVWDPDNPYARKPERRLRALCELCAA